MQKSVKRSRDTRGWRTCSEGFSDFFSNASVSTTKSKTVDKSRRKSTDKHNEQSFGHGNIFEKLAFPSEDTSQSIAWSSSESEEEKKIIEPVIKRKKLSPRPASSRKTRSAIKQRKPTVEDTVVEISSTSDTEKERVDKTSQETSTNFSGKSEVLSIKSYDSDTDSKNAHTGNKTPPQVVDSQSTVSISTQSPVDTQSGLKASDWVKSLQLKTPSKADQPSTSCEVEDSVKKKKKHSRGGLAEQLTRLQNRDKSSVRVWKHQQTSVSTSQDARSICLKVVGFESLYSLQLLKCKTVTDDLDSQADCSTTHGDDRLVMIPFCQAEQLKLQPGSVFKIYPPWQQLELNTGQQIMLCTKYCHVLAQSDGQEQEEKSEESESPAESVPVKAIWNCPCAQGLCRSQSLCPAYQFPCIPGYVQDLNKLDTKTQEKDNNSNTLRAATILPRSVAGESSHPKISLVSSSDLKPVTTHLQTIGLKTHGSRKSSQSSDSNGSKIFDSILESIEYDKSKGDKHARCLCFKGHVHKKAQIYDEKGSMIRCDLFVEDVVGTVIVIRLAKNTVQKLEMEENCLEGKSFQFTGLKVESRVTRDRDPELLSMMDRVWSGTTHNRLTSQDTNEDVQDTGKTEAPAGFCYILGESDRSTVDISPCLVDLYPERHLKFHAISDIPKLSDPCVRCDYLVRVVYLHYDEKNKHKLQSAYVIDGSQTIPVCMKYKKSVNELNLTLKEHSHGCKLIKDLCVYNGNITVDDYTVISSATDPENHVKYGDVIKSLESLNVVAEPISSHSRIRDLVGVTGVICEVDEESAYSWEVCKVCGSDQVQIDTITGVATCTDCKKTMSDLDVRMKMEVIVKVSDTNMRVKCDLLQSTIESLLPKDEEDDDGYELSSVLDKHLGPLHCVIVQTGKQWPFFLKEIRLLS